MFEWVLNTSLNSISCNVLNNSLNSRKKNKIRIMVYKDLVSRVAEKQEFEQRNCEFQKFLFSLGIFFNDNNVAKLMVYNAVCENVITKHIGCHSLCCVFPTGELVETSFFLFLNTLSRFFNVMNIINEEMVRLTGHKSCKDH